MSLALEERIEQLEAEVAYWKSEAQVQASYQVRTVISDTFGLTPAEAWLVATLHAADGRVISYDRLMEDMPDHRRSDFSNERNILSVMVSRIRKKVDAAFIITSRPMGYKLSTAGLEIINKELRGLEK